MAERQVPPLITLILPVYNGRRFLAEAVSAVRAQTYPHIELVVVDDGSTDGSAELARAAIGTMPRSRVISLARNTAKNGALAAGLRSSRGPFVMEINADDILEPDAVQRLVDEMLVDSDTDCTFGDHSIIDENGRHDPSETRTRSRMSGRAALGAGPVADVRRRQLRQGLIPAGVCALIRREAIGDWPGTTLTHTDYWLAWCAARRERVRYVGGPAIARYRVHSRSLSMSFHARRRAVARIRMDLAIVSQARVGEYPVLLRRFAAHVRDLVLGVHGYFLVRAIVRGVRGHRSR